MITFYFAELVMQVLKTLCRKLGDPAGRTALAKRAIEWALRKAGFSKARTQRLIFKLWTPIK